MAVRTVRSWGPSTASSPAASGRFRVEPPTAGESVRNFISLKETSWSVESPTESTF